MASIIAYYICKWLDRKFRKQLALKKRKTGLALLSFLSMLKHLLFILNNKLKTKIGQATLFKAWENQK